MLSRQQQSAYKHDFKKKLPENQGGGRVKGHIWTRFLKQQLSKS